MLTLCSLCILISFNLLIAFDNFWIVSALMLHLLPGFSSVGWIPLIVDCGFEIHPKNQTNWMKSFQMVQHLFQSVTLQRKLSYIINYLLVVKNTECVFQSCFFLFHKLSCNSLLNYRYIFLYICSYFHWIFMYLSSLNILYEEQNQNDSLILSSLSCTNGSTWV